MKHLDNQKGIALVTALMLTLISLTIVMYLMYMMTMGTKMSGANKRYKTALSASYGATDLVAKDFVNAMFSNLSTPSVPLKLLDPTNKIAMLTAPDSILRQKLTSPSSMWTDEASKLYDPKVAPDFTITLNSATSDPFTVFGKIVETDCSDKRPYPQGKCTGSDLSGIDQLDNGAAVTGLSAGIPPVNRPALYRIEIRSERSSNPKERANLSVLYAF